MRKIITVAFIWLITLAGSLLPAQAQRGGPPRQLTGMDLHELQSQYQERVDKGERAYIVPLADVLFHSGAFGRALIMYYKADSLNLQLSNEQKRNFAHAARRRGLASPHDGNDRYFSTEWDQLARIRPFCNNSSHEDFAPFVWHDLLFVTSSRDTGTRREGGTYRLTRMPFLNVFAFDDDCGEVSLDFLPASINSRYHDGPIAIAADTSLVVVSRNYSRPNRDGVQTVYLAYFTRTNGKWSREQSFPANDPSYYVQHPYFDDETNTLYFSSNMPGGMGGFDIYRVSWDGVGWGRIENMGTSVNSIYDEVFPSVSPGGNLVFSTNHLSTSGGLDIVMMQGRQRMLFPFPINSVYDDFAMTFVDEHSGYFSTNRDFEAFGDNVYFFELYSPESRPFIVRVVDRASQVPLDGATVSFFSINPALDDQATTGGDGEAVIYYGTAEPFKVALGVTRDGYYERDLISDGFEFDQERWMLTVALDRIPDNEAIQEAIQQGYFVVYFDNHHPEPNSRRPTTELTFDQTFDQYRANWPTYFNRTASDHDELAAFFEEAEKATDQLNWLAEFLLSEFRDGRHYVIVFTSHASPLGSDQYNLLLSRRRFASVENFLKAWDGGSLRPYIDAGRLRYENVSFGSQLAMPDVSADPRDLSRSVYGVEAARERKVTISWRRDAATDGGIDARSILEFEQAQMDEVLGAPGVDNENIYHIVVASFTELDVAEAYAADLRRRTSASAFVLPRTPEGYYRVSHSRFASREAAERALPEVRRQVGPGSWVFGP